VTTRAVIGGLVVVVGASGAAWALTGPQAAPAATVVRALADCAGAATLGLAVVPMLDTGRHRTELTLRAGRPLGWAAGLWLFTELCRLAVGAAAAAAVPVSRVGLTTTAEFATATSAGRSGLFSLAAAALVLVVTFAVPKTPPAAVGAAGVAAVGLVARTIGGHMSASVPGAIAIAVHVLAAAVWCGTLAGLVLTVDHRGQWARVLPRFSEMSLWCVIALLVGGVTGALVVLDSAAQLFATGYGRVLLVKIVLTVVLTALAWRNRARWLPAAKSHRVTA
jgi:copper resistance protein D